MVGRLGAEVGFRGRGCPARLGERVASAVGEGSVAVQLLHNLFAADRLHPRLCIYGGENRLQGLAAQIEAFCAVPGQITGGVTVA
jgi:hypothetical protein